MKKIVVSAGFILSVFFANAQAKSVLHLKNKKVSFYHTVVAKETLTGIAKMYNIPLAELAKENNFDKNTSLKIDQKVAVSIPVTQLNQKSKTSSPLFYTVEAKENLSQISKKFNGISVANLKNWNNLKSNEIDNGDKLIIGYLPGAALKSDDKTASGKNIMSKNSSLEQKVRVNVENTLNIRKGPDAELTVVAVAQKDEILTLIKNLNNEWSFVRTGDGTEGFAVSQYLVPAEEKVVVSNKKDTPKGKEMKVMGTAINIRKGPSIADQVVATAQQEDKLLVLKEINKDWVLVKLNDGTEGYAAAQFIGNLDAKIEKPVVVTEVPKGKEMKVTGTTVNIRKGPSIADQVIATAQQEDKLLVLKEINKDWVLVKLSDGTEGYAASQFIGSLDTKIAVSKPAATEKQIKVIGTLLNIRKGAGVDFEVVAQAKQDDELVLIRQINSDWANVRTGDGKEGYVASLYLDLPGNKEKLAAQQAALAAAAMEQAKADAEKEKVQPEEKPSVKAEDKTSQTAGNNYFENQYKRGTQTKTVAASIFKTDIGWNDGGKYYILIDAATPGSIVKVINPVNKKFIYAKVLGNMNGMDINNGFDIRISDAAAANLDIKNTDKFNVEINYTP